MRNNKDRSLSIISVDEIKKLLIESLLNLDNIDPKLNLDEETATALFSQLDSLNVEVFLSNVEDKLINIYPIMLEVKDLRENPSLSGFANFIIYKIHQQQEK